jgi:hypothetical protein
MMAVLALTGIDAVLVPVALRLAWGLPANKMRFHWAFAVGFCLLIFAAALFADGLTAAISIALVGPLVGSAALVLGSLRVRTEGKFTERAYFDQLDESPTASVEQFRPIHKVASDESTGIPLPIRAVGIDGVVTLDRDHLRIERKGIGAFVRGMRAPPEEIPLVSIKLFMYKPPSAPINGYMRFVVEGETDSPATTRSALSDKRTVFLKEAQQAAFEYLRDVLAGMNVKPTAQM